MTKTAPLGPIKSSQHSKAIKAAIHESISNYAHHPSFDGGLSYPPLSVQFRIADLTVRHVCARFADPGPIGEASLAVYNRQDPQSLFAFKFLAYKASVVRQKSLDLLTAESRRSQRLLIVGCPWT